MKQSSHLAAAGASIAALALFLVPVTGSAAGGRRRSAPAVEVSVRVEGMRSGLLGATPVNASAQAIDPDGKPADTCEGDTVAVALQDATHGRWSAGPYYSGLGYSVAGILGESHPFSSPYYWSLWIDGKAATAGICTAPLHRGEQILFFPQCSAESAAKCPLGMFDPPVLQVRGPAGARVGNTIVVRVIALDNLTGRPSPARAARLSAAGHTVSADAHGQARLRLTRAGTLRILASAFGAVRDELTVSVRR